MARKKKFISQEYSSQSGGKNLKEGTRTSRGAIIFTSVFFSFAVSIGIFLISFTVIFFFSEVQGSSMMKTINANYLPGKINTDSVLVNRFKEPKRGDIIIVKHFFSNSTEYEYHIKRLIALGGESICFVDIGDRYRIEVNGVNYDQYFSLDPYYGQNMKNREYNALYNYQQNTSYPIHNTLPQFRTHYTQDQVSVPFVQYVPERGRNEFVLPKSHFWYMGDNRGGSGVDEDLHYMSRDCAYYGPEGVSNIVGTVVEVVKEQTAPEWIWNKIVWVFTFKWIR